MSAKQDQQAAGPSAAGRPDEQRPSNAQKDPRDWKTGDEPMTGAQASYLHTLAEQQGEEVPDDLTKAEASEKIDELRGATGVSGGAKGAAGVENTRKDPEHWKTGDEPMTGAQASYLQTLSQEAGVEFDPGLTKAEASKRIDELQAKTGRGQAQQE
ncbi:DUF3072 domain-containing protein [Sorangium sp. So ce1182]